MCRSGARRASGRIREYLAQARSDGDLARQIVRVAASIGQLDVYALRPNTDTAYQLRPVVWQHAGLFHNVDRSLETGHFAIDAERLDKNSAASEVAGRPLLLRKNEANRLLRRRPLGEAEIRRIGETIIGDFRRENPDKVLRKVDFIAMFKKRVPGSTKEAAKQAWGQCAPPSWRSPGARPQTNRYPDYPGISSDPPQSVDMT